MRKKGGKDARGADTSGYAGHKPNAPDFADRVIVGLPLRTAAKAKLPPPATGASAVGTKGTMADDGAFESASHIFVVLGASASQ